MQSNFGLSPPYNARSDAVRNGETGRWGGRVVEGAGLENR